MDSTEVGIDPATYVDAYRAASATGSAARRTPGRELARSGVYEVPESDAPVEVILRFAATYNAYELFAEGPAQLERIAQQIYDDIARHGRVPEWLRVDLARAVLFYAYRADYFGRGYGPYEPMRTLVDGIRQLSGAWVEQRGRVRPAVAPATRVDGTPT